MWRWRNCETLHVRIATLQEQSPPTSTVALAPKTWIWQQEWKQPTDCLFSICHSILKNIGCTSIHLSISPSLSLSHDVDVHMHHICRLSIYIYSYLVSANIFFGWHLHTNEDLETCHSAGYYVSVIQDSAIAFKLCMLLRCLCKQQLPWP